MKKFTIAAVAAAMVLTAVTPAQGTASGSGIQDTTTITSGPWMMRKSTGDKTVDRLWYIMDRTLNAAEADTMRSMFRGMPGYTSYTMQKAIINAIDNNAKNSTTYGSWSSHDWASANGMTDMDIYNALENGLGWSEKGVLHNWGSTATTSQMMAVTKLVRNGGWANSMWTTSGMG